MSFGERQEVAALRRNADFALRGGVLFSLTSDRPSGMHLLLLADGRSAGAFSVEDHGADLLQRAAAFVQNGAAMHRSSMADEVDLLLEPADTAEAHALLDALEATLEGHSRVIATVLPRDGQLHRFVMDAHGDVVFASESLPTEDIVDLRRAALTAVHGSSVVVLGNQLFVERLQAIEETTLVAMRPVNAENQEPLPDKEPVLSVCHDVHGEHRNTSSEWRLNQ